MDLWLNRYQTKKKEDIFVLIPIKLTMLISDHE